MLGLTHCLSTKPRLYTEPCANNPNCITHCAVSCGCNCCITGLELDITRQKTLLKAAVFGRAFVPNMPAGMLKDLTIKLRVLNALREPGVGLPLTMPQLEALTLPVVVHR